MNPLPLGNMPLATFLSEYWQKKPLLIRNVLTEITSPISADILAGLACEEGVESRLIIQGNTENDWNLKHGPFNDEIFSSLPESHWTLLVQAVDHWVPAAASLLEQFSFIPRWRIDDLMVSYASDGGGVGPHFDNYDVFLVQTSGKRQWEIGGIYDKNASLRENLPVTILSKFSPVETWLLEPGDILYVPPGFGHNGIAQGDDCMTCSVGFRAPSHSEILREYTDHISDKLSEALRYEDPDLTAQENSGEISTQTLDKVQNILRTYTEDKEFIGDWFGRYITTCKYPQADDLESEPTELSHNLEDLKKHLSIGGVIARNEGSRFAYQVKDKNNTLFVDGSCLDHSDDVNDLIEVLCAEIEFNNESFLQTDSNLELILTLLQHGALYLTNK